MRLDDGASGPVATSAPVSGRNWHCFESRSPGVPRHRGLSGELSPSEGAGRRPARRTGAPCADSGGTSAVSRARINQEITDARSCLSPGRCAHEAPFTPGVATDCSRSLCRRIGGPWIYFEFDRADTSCHALQRRARNRHLQFRSSAPVCRAERGPPSACDPRAGPGVHGVDLCHRGAGRSVGRSVVFAGPLQPQGTRVALPIKRSGTPGPRRTPRRRAQAMAASPPSRQPNPSQADSTGPRRPATFNGSSRASQALSSWCRRTRPATWRSRMTRGRGVPSTSG